MDQWPTVRRAEATPPAPAEQGQHGNEQQEKRNELHPSMEQCSQPSIRFGTHSLVV
jgi:hypothetical protein